MSALCTHIYMCVWQAFLYVSYKNVNKAYIIPAISRYKNGSGREAHLVFRTCNLKTQSFKENKCVKMHVHLQQFDIKVRIGEKKLHVALWKCKCLKYKNYICRF